MTGMSENVFLNIKNKSMTITAKIEVPEGRANGAILVQGGRFGGWALYVKNGVPAYDYNFLGLERTQPMVFSADETADVGIDLATPVVEVIGSEAKSRFTGRIPKVTIEVK